MSARTSPLAERLRGHVDTLADLLDLDDREDHAALVADLGAIADAIAGTASAVYEATVDRHVGYAGERCLGTVSLYRDDDRPGIGRPAEALHEVGLFDAVGTGARVRVTTTVEVLEHVDPPAECLNPWHAYPNGKRNPRCIDAPPAIVPEPAS